MARLISVYLDAGPKWVFACALDWPGWCRRGRGEEEAIDTLLSYAPRYRDAVGQSVPARGVEVMGRISSGTVVDIGALGGPGPWDAKPWGKGEAGRQIPLLEAAWASFDQVATTAPAQLRKGPRGGGRDTAAVIDHVREGERSYASKLGAKVPPRTAWPDQRQAITAALVDPEGGAKWPARYAIRRVTWHVLDHLWEIEDKSEP